VRRLQVHAALHSLAADPSWHHLRLTLNQRVIDSKSTAGFTATDEIGIELNDLPEALAIGRVHQSCLLYPVVPFSLSRSPRMLMHAVHRAVAVISLERPGWNRNLTSLRLTHGYRVVRSFFLLMTAVTLY
jgi:hypothetical protein